MKRSFSLSAGDGSSRDKFPFRKDFPGFDKKPPALAGVCGTSPFFRNDVPGSDKKPPPEAGV